MWVGAALLEITVTVLPALLIDTMRGAVSEAGAFVGVKVRLGLAPVKFNVK
jgi:hypothetical protein